MKNLKDKIIWCLERYPEARNSDIFLTNAIWVNYYPDKIINNKGELSVRLLDIYELPTVDDVKRIRAKIQNEENQYLPTDIKVVKQRKLNEEKWRQYLGYSLPPDFDLNELNVVDQDRDAV